MLQLKCTQRDTKSWNSQDNLSLSLSPSPLPASHSLSGRWNLSLALLPVFIPASPLVAGLVAAWKCSQMSKKNGGEV